MTELPNTDPRVEQTSKRPGFTLFFVGAWIAAGSAAILRAGGIGSATGVSLGLLESVESDVPGVTHGAWQICDWVHHEPGQTIMFCILGATLLPFLFGFRGAIARFVYGGLAVIALACFLALPYATFGPMATLRESGAFPAPSDR